MLSTLLSMHALYFFLISLLNVILSSIKSICTVRYGRGVNVIANVLAYSFYVIVVKQTADLPLTITIIATAVSNALGVWLSYAALDKLRKDRLWKVEVVVANCFADAIHTELVSIPHNYIKLGQNTLFAFYCETKSDTAAVIKYCKTVQGKFFAAENKL